MATAGPNSPSISLDFGGDFNWVDTDNIFTSNNVYTTLTDNIGGGTGGIRATGFGFSIPDGATIDGVTVETEIKSTNQTSCLFQSIRLLSNGLSIGNAKFPNTGISAVENYVSHGGPADIWGATLNRDVINSSTFGVQIIIYAENSHTVSIDHIRITITYTAAGAGGSTAVTVSRNRNNGLRSNNLKNPRSFNVL